MIKGKQGILYVKNTSKSNFFTNKPIFTNNTPIDSARRAKTHKHFKHLKKIVSIQRRLRKSSKYYRQKTSEVFRDTLFPFHVSDM
jgi:hypothetical protein